MPFFQREPFTHAQAIYVWAGVDQPGFFEVTVEGDAPKISFGFELKKDVNSAGALSVEVMGWTGPLTSPAETTPYSATGRFNGTFSNEVVVTGLNKTEIVHVKEVTFTTDEKFMSLFSSP